MGRFLLRGALGASLLAVLLIAGALGYRALRQDENAQAFAIRTRDGVEEAGYVRIGGLRQWIQIRGEHRDNPVLLILAGGPGDSLIPRTAIFRPWEKYFTVVQWDQRGTGKTYEENGTDEDPMTIDQYTRDTIEVAEYLRSRLKKPKIILVGHSWGTVPGTRVAKFRPDLLYAYVGTGQVVERIKGEQAVYWNLLKKSAASGDRDTVRALKRIGPPPYDSEEKLVTLRAISQSQARDETSFARRLLPILLFAPNYSLWDFFSLRRSSGFAARRMFFEISTYDVTKLGRDFDVPIFIFNGDQDWVTPMNTSKAWFDTIRAPGKGYVVLRGGGHMAVQTMPDVFLRELVARVRPLALARRAQGK